MLATEYWLEGRWKEAEQLVVQVTETSKTKLGADHPDTLLRMASLAATYEKLGRCEELEQFKIQVRKICKTKLGVDHPDTLMGIAQLAVVRKSSGHSAEGISLRRSC